jgi:hypothetical protein
LPFIDATCQAIADAQRHDETAARADAARAKIADCDRRLANYRKTLDLGGPTATLVGWMAEVDAERLPAEATLYANFGIALTYHLTPRSSPSRPPSNQRAPGQAKGRLMYLRACRRGDLNPHEIALTRPST